MAIEIERFIRIQSSEQRPGRDMPDWRTIPNCSRSRVWHVSAADALPEEVEPGTTARRLIFHIGFVDGVTRGSRVTYLGENFSVLGISDSTRLRGLELRCSPAA